MQVLREYRKETKHFIRIFLFVCFASLFFKTGSHGAQDGVKFFCIAEGDLKPLILYLLSSPHREFRWQVWGTKIPPHAHTPFIRELSL